MKINIELDLRREEDKHQYEIYKQAYETYRFVGDFKNYLREQYKYAELTDEQSDYLDKIRDKFYELANEYHINFEV